MDVSILNPNKVSESKHQLVRGVIIKLFQEGKLEFNSFLKYFGETNNISKNIHLDMQGVPIKTQDFLRFFSGKTKQLDSLV